MSSLIIKHLFFWGYFVPAALVKKCQKIFTPGCLWSHPCCPASHQNAGSNSTSSSEAHYLLMACQRATITNLSCFPSGIAWDFIWFDFMLHTGLGWHRPWYASKCRGLLLLILFLKIPPTLLIFLQVAEAVVLAVTRSPVETDSCLKFSTWKT